MAASPPPPAHTAVGSRQRGGWVGLQGCRHALKLRHSFSVDQRTRMELGLDLDFEQGALQQMLKGAAPWASVLYKFDAEDEGKGALELNPLWATYNRSWCLGTKGAWWEVPLDAKLGLTFTGKPHVEVGIGNVPLVLTLAATLLALGKPLSIKRKEVGGLALHFPITAGGTKREHSLQERVEVDASLQREGRGLKLEFQQLNGVLRLRQE